MSFVFFFEIMYARPMVYIDKKVDIWWKELRKLQMFSCKQTYNHSHSKYGISKTYKIKSAKYKEGRGIKKY